MISEKSIKTELSNFRHELRNDLTVIKLNLAMLEKNPDKKNGYIKKIDERIDKIMKNLLGFKPIP